jgi:hypothetical protein
MSDSIFVQETITRMGAFSRLLSDSASINDFLSPQRALAPVALIENLNVNDMIGESNSFFRIAEENILVSDSIIKGMSLAITDSLSVTDEITNLALEIHLNLSETLTLAPSFFTPELAIFVQPLGEAILLADSISQSESILVILNESVLLGDQMTSMGDQWLLNLGESLILQESNLVKMTMHSPSPPDNGAFGDIEMPDVEMTPDSSYVVPQQATMLQGTYDMTDGLRSVLEEIEMPVYEIDEAALNSDMSMILPVFGLEVDESDDTLGGTAFITPIISDAPEGIEMIIPVDVSSGMESDVGMTDMMFSFTPAVTSTDFALSITVSNELPTDVSNVVGTAAFFIDVHNAGDSESGLTPSDPAFYIEPPVFTFSIPEEWADSENIGRVGGDGPLITLFLYNDESGEWEEIEIIDWPSSAVNGEFTYTAILPHFSIYSVTGESGRSGGGSGGVIQDKFNISRKIVDSISIRAETQTILEAEQVVEGKDISEQLNEVLKFVAEPVYSTQTFIVNDISVTVTVIDITPDKIFTNAAIAKTVFDITNEGTVDEIVELKYWYADRTGNRLYESSEQLFITSGDSIQKSVEIPFSAPGNYDIVVEAQTLEGATSSTSINVTIPWLSVNLFIIMGIAAALLIAVAGIVTYMLKFKPRKPEVSIVRSAKTERVQLKIKVPTKVEYITFNYNCGHTTRVPKSNMEKWMIEGKIPYLDLSEKSIDLAVSCSHCSSSKGFKQKG